MLGAPPGQRFSWQHGSGFVIRWLKRFDSAVQGRPKAAPLRRRRPLKWQSGCQQAQNSLKRIYVGCQPRNAKRRFWFETQCPSSLAMQLPSLHPPVTPAHLLPFSDTTLHRLYMPNPSPPLLQSQFPHCCCLQCLATGTHPITHSSSSFNLGLLHRNCLSESHPTPHHPLSAAVHLQSLRIQPVTVQLPKLPHITNCKHGLQDVEGAEKEMEAEEAGQCERTCPPCQRSGKCISCAKLSQSSAVSCGTCSQVACESRCHVLRFQKFDVSAQFILARVLDCRSVFC